MTTPEPSARPRTGTPGRIRRRVREPRALGVDVGDGGRARRDSRRIARRAAGAAAGADYARLDQDDEEGGRKTDGRRLRDEGDDLPDGRHAPQFSS